MHKFSLSLKKTSPAVAALAASTALLTTVSTLSPAVAPAGPGVIPAVLEAHTVDRPHSVGRWLVDDAGKVVTFHGENVVAKRAPWTPESQGFNEEDAAFLAQQGFNAVRLGLSWEATEPQPGQFDDAYLANVKHTVELLHQHGISTFLEYHQDMYSELLGGNGAPAWATFDDGLPGAHAGLMFGQFVPALHRAFENFFANRAGIRDHYVAMWAHTAEFFADTPGLIGYSPINEPSAGAPTILCALNFCPESTLQQLRDLNAQVAQAIRAHDPRTGIWITGYVTTVMGAPAHMGPKVDNNTAYAFNSYAKLCTSIPLPLPEFLCEPEHRHHMNQAWDYANSQGMPAIMAEFAASPNPAVSRNQARLSDETMQSRFHWQYGGYDPTTAASSSEVQAIVREPRAPITPENVNWDVLRAEATPYPAAVAGTPTGWSNNGNFVATWIPERVEGGRFEPGAVSTIKVPEIWAPQGYRVTVEGGHALNADIPAAHTPGTDVLHGTDLLISGDGGPVRVIISPA